MKNYLFLKMVQFLILNIWYVLLWIKCGFTWFYFHFTQHPNFVGKMLGCKFCLCLLPQWAGLNGCEQYISWMPFGKWSLSLLWPSEELPRTNLDAWWQRDYIIKLTGDYNSYINELYVKSSRLTELSKPCMCRVMDLAFLLEELRKNWGFFLLSGGGLAGALRIS